MKNAIMNIVNIIAFSVGCLIGIGYVVVRLAIPIIILIIAWKYLAGA